MKKVLSGFFFAALLLPAVKRERSVEGSRALEGPMLKTDIAQFGLREDSLTRMVCLASAFGAAMLMQACASQNIGTVDKNSKDVAVISADSALGGWLSGLEVVMREVDGVTIASSTHSVTVAPGPHKLTVECSGAGSTNTQFLEIDARAGAHYQLSPLVNGGAYPCKAVVEEK